MSILSQFLRQKNIKYWVTQQIKEVSKNCTNKEQLVLKCVLTKLSIPTFKKMWDFWICLQRASKNASMYKENLSRCFCSSLITSSAVCAQRRKDLRFFKEPFVFVSFQQRRGGNKSQVILWVMGEGERLSSTLKAPFGRSNQQARRMHSRQIEWGQKAEAASGPYFCRLHFLCAAKKRRLAAPNCLLEIRRFDFYLETSARHSTRE